MIKWKNIKYPKLNGVAKDRAEFDKYNKLANGHLKVVSEIEEEKISDQTADLINDVVSGQDQDSSPKSKGSKKK